jgi:hypothetical protein
MCSGPVLLAGTVTVLAVTGRGLAVCNSALTYGVTPLPETCTQTALLAGTGFWSLEKFWWKQRKILSWLTWNMLKLWKKISCWAFNSNTWEAEAGELRLQGQLGLCSEETLREGERKAGRKGGSVRLYRVVPVEFYSCGWLWSIRYLSPISKPEGLPPDSHDAYVLAALLRIAEGCKSGEPIADLGDFPGWAKAAGRRRVCRPIVIVWERGC